MVKVFDFYSIEQYDSYTINITKKDYDKMQNSITYLKNKYNIEILNLYDKEKINSKKYDFFNQREFIILHKKILLSIIRDILNIYQKELKGLEVVFLSGSFARGTNKISSDIGFFRKFKCLIN